MFGPTGEIFFRAFEGNSRFAYRVREDGTGLRKAIEQPIVALSGVSPDGQWLVAKLPGREGSRTVALALQGGSAIPLTTGGAFLAGDIRVRWSPDGRRIFIPVPTAGGPISVNGRTYIVPLRQGHVLPQTPAAGFRSEAEITELAGARGVDAFDVAPAPTAGVYAFARQTVQRNLYRIPLP